MIRSLLFFVPVSLYPTIVYSNRSCRFFFTSCLLPSKSSDPCVSMDSLPFIDTGSVPDFSSSFRHRLAVYAKIESSQSRSIVCICFGYPTNQALTRQLAHHAYLQDHSPRHEKEYFLQLFKDTKNPSCHVSVQACIRPIYLSSFPCTDVGFFVSPTTILRIKSCSDLRACS